MKYINLGKNRYKFKKVGNIFYNIFTASCNFLDKDSIRALTTMLTMMEINQLKENAELNANTFELKAKKYAKNIAEFLKLNGSVPSNMDSWIMLFIVAVKGDNKADLNNNLREIESLRPQMEEIVFEGFVEYIMAGLNDIESMELELVQALHTELKDICYNKTGKLKPEILEKLLKHRHETLERLRKSIHNSFQNNRLLGRFINRLRQNKVETLRKIIRTSIINFVKHRSVSKELALSTAKRAGTLVTKYFLRKSYMENILKRKCDDKMRAQYNRAKGADRLWCMLNSHDPTKFDKLPEILAANIQYKREARRLRGLGISNLNAHIQAHDNIDHNKDKTRAYRYINNNSKELEHSV